MALNRKTLIRSLGYAAFAVFAFVACLYLTFPGEAVAQRMRYEIQRRSGGSVTATVGSTGLSLPLGVTARDVELRLKQENDDDIRIPLASLGGSLDALALLTFTVKPRLSAEIGEGSVDAAIVQGADSNYVEADLDSVNLIRPPVLPSLLGVPMGGEISANGAYTLAKKPADSSGSMTLALKGMNIGPGPVAGITIPEAISLGTVEFDLAIEEGRLVIKDYKQEGGQLDLQLSGGLNLSPRFMSSNLDACVKFKFTDQEFLKTYPKLETAVQLAGARFKKDGEGYLNVPLKGALSRPNGKTGVVAGRSVCGAGGRAPRRNNRNAR